MAVRASPKGCKLAHFSFTADPGGYGRLREVREVREVAVKSSPGTLPRKETENRLPKQET